MEPWVPLLRKKKRKEEEGSEDAVLWTVRMRDGPQAKDRKPGNGQVRTDPPEGSAWAAPGRAGRSPRTRRCTRSAPGQEARPPYMPGRALDLRSRIPRVFAVSLLTVQPQCYQKLL